MEAPGVLEPIYMHYKWEKGVMNVYIHDNVNSLPCFLFFLFFLLFFFFFFFFAAMFIERNAELYLFPLFYSAQLHPKWKGSGNLNACELNAGGQISLSCHK